MKRNDLFEDYQRVIYKIKKNYSAIVIPQIVVGETLLKIIENSKPLEKDQNVCDFVKFLEDKKHIDFHNDIPPLYDKVMSTAIGIKQNVDNNDYCDAVIVAHALNDGKDCSLFTTDKGIHDSDYIFDLRRELEEKSKIKVNLLLSIE